MRKDNKTFEENLKRLYVLSGIKPINESKSSLSTVVETLKINDVNYGIVKESGSYYIKSTKSDIINESTLSYIGGEANRREYKYNSYADALKNLNMMKINMQESFTPQEVDEDTDMDAASDTGEEMGAPEMTEQLEKDIMGDQNGAPGQGGGMPPAPEPAPQGMPPAPDQGGIPPAPEVAPAPAPDQSSNPAQDAEFAQNGDGGDQIDHFVGKLTGELRNQTESLDSNRLKGIINSVLAAVDLQKIDPDTRFEIGKRIKDGKNEQEGDDSGSDGSAAPAPEGQPQPETAPTPAPEQGAPEEQPVQEVFNEVDDLKINEFFHSNRKEVIMEGQKLKVKNILVETKGNQVILTKGDKFFTYNVSDKTIGKLNQLKEHKTTKLMNEEIANYFKKNI